MEGQKYSVPKQSVIFLADRTFLNEDGKRQSNQQIFDEIIRMIQNARQYILLDMFLYNDFQGDPPENIRALAGDLTQALIAKKKQNPDIAITVISDPLNTVYGGAPSPYFEQLRRHDIPVIITDLTKLRDSNPMYAAIWRTFFQWFGNTATEGFMPHPFSANGRNVTIRSWLALLNFKANHRKLIVADETQPDGTAKMATLITSANPHDGSSAHSNVAIKVNDKVWRDTIKSEKAIAGFSGASIPSAPDKVADEDGKTTVRLLTEGAIRKRIIELIDSTKASDSLDMAMFYLSERSIVKALLRAAMRDVAIRVVLDPNKDAFGHTKNGVPNRPVAHELVQKSGNKIKLRWCDTHGEQCHTKLLLFRIGEQQIMTAGSANLTRRNIGDYNLETNILISADNEIPAITAARKYFYEIWSNKNGRTYTADYSRYSGASSFKTFLYRVQEATGLSSF